LKNYDRLLFEQLTAIFQGRYDAGSDRIGGFGRVEMRSRYLPNTCYRHDFPTLRNFGRGGFVYRYSCGAF
jgi:hypothetical protein